MDRLVATICGVLVTTVAVINLWHLPVVVDMSRFMLGDTPSIEVVVARALAHSSASRTLIVVADKVDNKSTAILSKSIEREIRADAELMSALEYISASPPAGVEEALWRLYKPRVRQFLAPSKEEAQKKVSPAGIDKALDDLLHELRGAQSSLVARLAPEDPWLVLPRRFKYEISSPGGLRVTEGRFTANNGSSAVLFLRTRDSAFDGAKHARLLAAIEEVKQRVRQELGSVEFRMSGLHRFAVAVQRSMQLDIAMISSLSVISLLVIFVFLFRSIRVLASAWIVVSSGFVCGLMVTRMVFGEIHGLTLAFGSSLIGVSIDYAIHYYVHLVTSKDKISPRALMFKLWPGLLLGAITTVVGFVALAFSSIPGLFEVCVFAASGILGALMATWVFLPVLAPLNAYPKTARWVAQKVDETMSAMTWLTNGRRGQVVVGLLGIVTISGWLLVKWDNDISQLAKMPASLVAEEEAVRADIGAFEQKRCVVALGRTREEALRVNDSVYMALSLAVKDKEIERFRSVGTWLPSAQTQEEVAQVLQADMNLMERLKRQSKTRGFAEDAFESFDELLSSPLPPVLTLEALQLSPLKPWVQNFFIGLEHGSTSLFGVVSFLGGVADEQALMHRVQDIPGALWLDQGKLYNEANGHYQKRTAIGMLVGFLSVGCLVWIRYRKRYECLTALLPATTAVVVVVGCLGWLGVHLNLVALTALLMVFSMGVDYGVFLAEPQPDRLATQLAVVVAWGSTVAGFGFLSVSSHPAMQSLGIVASLGVTVTLLTIPYVSSRRKVWR